jgi:hypothetical protein
MCQFKARDTYAAPCSLLFDLVCRGVYLQVTRGLLAGMSLLASGGSSS